MVFPSVVLKKYTDFKASLSLFVCYLLTRKYIFFIIQRVKPRAVPCPHQQPTRGDYSVSVTQSNTATPGATKQLLPLDRV